MKTALGVIGSLGCLALGLSFAPSAWGFAVDAPPVPTDAFGKVNASLLTPGLSYCFRYLDQEQGPSTTPPLVPELRAFDSETEACYTWWNANMFWWESGVISKGAAAALSSASQVGTRVGGGCSGRPVDASDVWYTPCNAPNHEHRPRGSLKPHSDRVRCYIRSDEQVHKHHLVELSKEKYDFCGYDDDGYPVGYKISQVNSRVIPGPAVGDLCTVTGCNPPPLTGFIGFLLSHRLWQNPSPAPIRCYIKQGPEGTVTRSGRSFAYCLVKVDGHDSVVDQRGASRAEILELIYQEFMGTLDDTCPGEWRTCMDDLCNRGAKGGPTVSTVVTTATAAAANEGQQDVITNPNNGNGQQDETPIPGVSSKELTAVGMIALILICICAVFFCIKAVCSSNDGRASQEEMQATLLVLKSMARRFNIPVDDEVERAAAARRRTPRPWFPAFLAPLFGSANRKDQGRAPRDAGMLRQHPISGRMRSGEASIDHAPAPASPYPGALAKISMTNLIQALASAFSQAEASILGTSRDSASGSGSGTGSGSRGSLDSGVFYEWVETQAGNLVMLTVTITGSAVNLAAHVMNDAAEHPVAHALRHRMVEYTYGDDMGGVGGPPRRHVVMATRRRPHSADTLGPTRVVGAPLSTASDGGGGVPRGGAAGVPTPDVASLTQDTGSTHTAPTSEPLVTDHTRRPHPVDDHDDVQGPESRTTEPRPSGGGDVGIFIGLGRDGAPDSRPSTSHHEDDPITLR